jgi:hypothetical protein
MPTRSGLLVVALALLLAAGCGPPKLNESRTWNLAAGEVNSLDLPAIATAQKVHVEFTSTGEVAVIAMKEEDAKGNSGLMNADVSKALGKGQGKSGEFSFDVPAKTPVRVIVGGIGPKSEVTLKVTNSK